MKRAPRPGITSFTGFHPSFHGAPWTPAEFYKMRHMRYIIAQCELPRYSKRGLNGSVPETATKSRKSFMKRDYFSCARTTRRAFAHSLHPSTMLSLSLSLLHRFSSPLRANTLSLSYTHTFLFLLGSFLPRILANRFLFGPSSLLVRDIFPRGHEPREDFSRAARIGIHASSSSILAPCSFIPLLLLGMILRSV